MFKKLSEEDIKHEWAKMLAKQTGYNYEACLVYLHSIHHVITESAKLGWKSFLLRVDPIQDENKERKEGKIIPFRRD